MGRIELAPFQGRWRPLKLALSGKYVGKQYWDNTENAGRCIPTWFVMDLSLSHSFRLPLGDLGVAVYVDNLLNRDYYAYAWVYRAWEGSEYVEAGLYPQAPRNLMVKVTYSF